MSADAGVSSESPEEDAVRKGPIMVRATAHLPGLKVGQIVWTDPSIPYVAMCLRAGLVVEVLP